jgi:hypothetical protein
MLGWVITVGAVSMVVAYEPAVRDCKLALSPNRRSNGQLPYRGMMGIQVSGFTVLAPAAACSCPTSKPSLELTTALSSEPFSGDGVSQWSAGTSSAADFGSASAPSEPRQSQDFPMSAVRSYDLVRQFT